MATAPKAVHSVPVEVYTRVASLLARLATDGPACELMREVRW